MPVTGTIATWLNGRVRVELSPRGFDVVLAGAGRLPSRVATYAAKFKAIEHAERLADGAPRDAEVTP